MASVTFKGAPVTLEGNLPAVGEKAPDFSLTGTDMQTKSLSDYKGKQVILNIFPSVDTGICAQSTRTFNSALSKLSDTVVLCISKDLPFAHSRFCGAEGLEDVISLSDFKNDQFEKAYGLKMTENALEGLLARAVVVVGTDGIITYTELVPEIVQEPNYDAAIDSL